MTEQARRRSPYQKYGKTEHKYRFRDCRHANFEMSYLRHPGSGDVHRFRCCSVCGSILENIVDRSPGSRLAA